ncbi:MAG: CoA pyrophosphatase [Nitrospinae bacterium]|nr:CoA pyrophosphatase [Nitrospinota bacterium]
MELDEFTRRASHALLMEPQGNAAPGRIMAATLAPVALINGEASFGFIRRSANLNYHPGQIAFPGGRMEPGETPVQTALREVEEETGIGGGHIKILGMLPLMDTASTGFAVWPVVGVVHGEPVMNVPNGEVEEFFWAPVDHFMNGSFVKRTTTLPGEGAPRPAFLYQGREIWGLTFRIVMRIVSLFEHRY